jgi:hypothetical protein
LQIEFPKLHIKERTEGDNEGNYVKVVDGGRGAVQWAGATRANQLVKGESRRGNCRTQDFSHEKVRGAEAVMRSLGASGHFLAKSEEAKDLLP